MGNLYNFGLSRSLAHQLHRLFHRPTASRIRWNALHSSVSSSEQTPPDLDVTVTQLYFRRDERQSPLELNQKLVQLVQKGYFQAAEQLRIESIRDQIDIEPNFIYEQAAITCLRWDDLDTTLADFRTWFSLIPQRNPLEQTCPPLEETDADHFADLRRILFSSPATRYPVILSFAIISASKGYIQPILNETLPVLVRYVSADIGTVWLNEMENAIMRYSVATPYLGTINHFRDLSIKACCQAGWLSHAMSILTNNPRFTLTTSTSILLSNALRDAGRMEELSVLNRRTASPPSFRQPQQTKSSSNVKATPCSHKPSVVSTLTRHDVAVELRRIIRRFRHSKVFYDINVPIFLTRLREVQGGASRIVQWVRKRALFAGPKCSIPWLEGELKYHLTQRRYDEVVKLYLAHFKVELPDAFANMLPAIASHYQFIPSTTSPDLALVKRWMVLKSIICLTPTLPEPVVLLRDLYSAYCLESVNPGEAHQVRSAFISSFGECGAPDDAVRVLKGRRAPYSKEVETLAGVLAHAGREQKALALLRHAASGKMKMTLFSGQVVCAPAGPLIYGRVIQGFVRVGLLKPALEAEAMMTENLGRDFNRSKMLLEVIDALRALEAQHASQ